MTETCQVPPPSGPPGASRPARVLLLADTHLGFDLPFHPRVQRRRRGPDFFANFERALSPALRGEVDAVVHGGDLLYRSKVPAELVRRAVEPLLRVAEAGVPVFVVPGNHERSAIPFGLLARHGRLHLFDRPRTFRLEVAGFQLALGGFPFERDVRARFPELLARSGLLDAQADCRLLCLHQAVEGARVGPADFTFRDGPDVVRAADLPSGLNAVLSGHIHRAQALTKDLAGRPLVAPVLYPGSIERTSFAERGERKGYLIVEVPRSEPARWRFHELPARPMVDLEFDGGGLGQAELEAGLGGRLSALPGDAVVRLRLAGDGLPPGWPSSADLRRLAPDSMNIELQLPGARPPRL